MSFTAPADNVLPSLIDDAIVLTGPTAAGKTSVAIALTERLRAKDRDAEILSLDSIAVYRGMDIGTAKPTAADRRRVKHHLIDLVDPSEDYSVALYLKAAHQIVADLRRQGRLAIFVGGTPMFLKGVLRGFDPGPPADWEFRESVEEDLRLHGIEALHQRLQQVDPIAAHKIAANDSRRMIRALEVAHKTGTPISHRQVQFDQQRTGDSCNVFSILWPRPLLHQRIKRRVDRMFANGLVDEVRALLDQYGELSRTAAQAVGYREIIDAMEGGRKRGQAPIAKWPEGCSALLVPDPFSATKESVATHTRQLAKRQETWFRSFSELRPIEVTEPLAAEQVAEQIESMLV